MQSIREAPSTLLTGRRVIFARRIWLVFFVIYLLLVIVGIPAALRQGVHPNPSWTPADTQRTAAVLGLSTQVFESIIIGITFFSMGTYLVLGALIYWRRSDDWVALLTSAVLIAFGGSYTIGPLLDQWSGIPAARFLSTLINSLVMVSFFLVLLIFPDGRFIPRWTYWPLFLLMGVYWWVQATGKNDQIDAIIAPFYFLLLGTIVYSQIYRYRRVSPPLQRQQTKWVMYGLVVGLTPILLVAVISIGFPDLNQVAMSDNSRVSVLFNLLGYLAWLSFITLLPLWFTIAILRSHLWDIDLIIRRTLVYGALTATLALVYFGSVVLLQNLFTALTSQQSAVVTVVSTLLIAALFTPLRRRIQRDIDRRFYRKKYDAEKIVAEFGASLRNEVNLEDLQGQIVSVVEETLMPESASIWLRDVK